MILLLRAFVTMGHAPWDWACEDAALGAALGGVLRSFGVRADLATYARPFLRGLLELVLGHANSDPHMSRDIDAAVSGLIGVISDMADPANN